MCFIHLIHLLRIRSRSKPGAQSSPRPVLSSQVRHRSVHRRASDHEGRHRRLAGDRSLFFLRRTWGDVGGITSRKTRRKHHDWMQNHHNATRLRLRLCESFGVVLPCVCVCFVLAPFALRTPTYLFGSDIMKHLGLVVNGGSMVKRFCPREVLSDGQWSRRHPHSGHQT